MKLANFASVEEVVDTLQPSYPVYCLRPDTIRAAAKLFLDHFPGRVLYAVKCNPNLEVMRLLHEAGIRHFDTASPREIALVRENFKDADCYYMHPVKGRAAIQLAHEVYRVDHYVIDHISELEKITEITGGGDASVILVRVKTPQHKALFKLADKFGCEVDEAIDLLRKVRDAGFQPGLAFHVGSQCQEPEAYASAMAVVDEIVKAAGVNLHYLDVGGGFPVDYVNDIPQPLTDYFDVIRDSAKKLNLRGDCTLMCEPGRALVASGCTLIVQVHLRKGDDLYINDGVYHSLSETMVCGLELPMRLIRKTPSEAKLIPYKIYGPTCDCTDVLQKRVMLPADVKEGDWIEIGQAGAYTNSMSTQFNGFYPETFVTVDSPPFLPPEKN
ncbi:MAG: type III PLP-dependent enzyme [Pseudomonadales bacterium]